MSEQWFEIEVWLPGRGALRTLVPGKTLQEARAYAETKYRGSIAFSVDKPAKPLLARSKNGKEKDARAMLQKRQRESRS